jgi:hypothetical protein
MLKVCLHEQCFSECLMRQPHPTPHKNRIIPIFGCGCRIRHSEKHCSCKQTIMYVDKPIKRTCSALVHSGCEFGISGLVKILECSKITVYMYLCYIPEAIVSVPLRVKFTLRVNFPKGCNLNPRVNSHPLVHPQG